MSNSIPQLPLVAKGGKGKKSKSSVYFAPVNLKVGYEVETLSRIGIVFEEISGEYKCLVDNFMNSVSTDDQLTTMKKLFDLLKENTQENVVQFIVIVLFESEPRHPVKCLLMKHFERWTEIQEIFIKLLSKQIMSHLSNNEYNYEKNNYTVSRLVACLENFTLGFQAVKLIESDVLQWLLHTLMGSLCHLKTQTSPEEKLNTTKLMHQILRVLLQIFQKASLNKTVNESVHSIISQIIECADVSVDNKCLCAMLHVAVMKSEGKHLWDKFGESPDVLSKSELWSTNDTNLLCFYYALFSTAPSNVIDLLDNEYSAEVKQMFHDIVQKIVDLTERVSGSVDATMAGARTVAIITNRLDAASRTNLNDPGLNELGSKKRRSNREELNESDSNLLELRHIESNDNKNISETGENKCETNMSNDKVNREASLRVALLVEGCLTSLSSHVGAAPRQLAAQAQVDLLNYYLLHHPEEGARWLSCSGAGAGSGAERLCRLQRAAEAGRRGGGGALPTALAPATLLPALLDTHTMLQASSLLSTYIRAECAAWGAGRVWGRWLQPALAQLSAPRLSPDALDHLVALLATALDCNDSLLDYILPLITRAEAIHPANIKCTLFLMHVILKSKVGKRYQDTENMWKGIIAFDVLGQAILHDDDQVVSMALCGGVRGGAGGGLRTLWCLLRAHAHRPLATHTRTLDLIQRFLKRVETEYRVKRKELNTQSDKGENCIQLLSRIRQLCFDNLLPGGNHYRRGISLFILKHIHSLQLDHHWTWIQDQVDTVLRHIDDTYDTNRHTAFHILLMCPLHLLKDAMSSSGMTSVEQIVSTCGARARDASGAALRIELLLYVAGARPLNHTAGGALDRQQDTDQTGALSTQVLSEQNITLVENEEEQILEQTRALDGQLVADQNTREALNRQEHFKQEDTQDKSSKVAQEKKEFVKECLKEEQETEAQETVGALTRQLVAEKCLRLAQSGFRASALHILHSQLKHLPLSSSIWCLSEELALKVLRLAAPLVEATSPEGYVPDTFFDMPTKPHPESKYLFTVGEEVMTSQTMLLYAWTSAKEAWCILCEVGVRVPGSHRLLLPLCDRLLRVRHRALLDYASTAYSTLLQHYYTKAQGNTQESEEVSAVFSRLERVVSAEISSGADGTRRGAGLTALCTALAGVSQDYCRRIATYVTGAIQGKSESAPHIAAALLRAKKLQRDIHQHLQHLMLAAFQQLHDTHTEMQWSCTSVISAGVRRALGPPGPGGVPGPSLRTTVFVSRYPALYDKITEIISDASSPTHRTRASLASALLVAGRVRGEGRGEGALWAGLQGAGGSPSCYVRRLGATAAAATLPTNMYLEHTSEVLSELSELTIEKNLCHGLILRLIAMIEAAPELKWSEVFASKLSDTLWIMDTACYPLIHEYINLVMLLLDRYPESLLQEYRTALGEKCGDVAVGKAQAGPGRELCSGAAVTAASALLPPALGGTILDAALRSNTYEVCLSSLKCYQTAPTYKVGGAQLGAVFTSHPHPECRRHALQLLVERDLIEYVIGKPPSNLIVSDVYNWKLLQLYEKWENAVENERALFIQGISRVLTNARENEAILDEISDEENYLAENMPNTLASSNQSQASSAQSEGSSAQSEGNFAQSEASSAQNEASFAQSGAEVTMGERAGKAVACVMFASSALTAAQNERNAADQLINEHANWLLDVCDDEDLFIPMCVLGAYARQVESQQRAEGAGVGAGRGGVRRRARGHPALLLALALLDFAVPVQEPDETSQYRAFERSWDPEIAEEGVWTAHIAPHLSLPAALAACGAHSPALTHVCGDNLDHFKQLICDPNSEVKHVNPKVVYLVNKLREIVFRVP